MANENRDERGRFAATTGTAHAGDAQARASGRYPVSPDYSGRRAMSSHPGSAVIETDERGRQSIAKAGKRQAVAEKVAQGMRIDNKNRSYSIIGK